MFWPTPYPMTTNLHLGGESPSRLELPVVPEASRPVPEFLPPAEDPVFPGYRSLGEGTVSGYSELAQVERDDEKGTATVVLENESATEYPWGIVEVDEVITHQTRDDDPARSSVVGDYTITVRLPDRVLAVQGVIHLESDRESFHLQYTRRLHRDGELVREKTWNETFPRDGQ